MTIHTGLTCGETMRAKRTRARCRACVLWFTMPTGDDMTDEAKAHCPRCRELKRLSPPKRPCLQCGKVFRPLSRWNRICTGCHVMLDKVVYSRAELNVEALRRAKRDIYS